MRHRVHDAELLDAVEAISPIVYEGPVWRVCRAGRHPGEGSNVPGRWSDGTFPVLYTSMEKDVALGEIFFHLFRKNPVPPSKLNHSVHKLGIKLGRALKLLDPSELKNLRIEEHEYFSKDFAAVRRDLFPKTQAVGAAASFLGFDGLFVPSARASGENVVLLVNNLEIAGEIRVEESEPVDWDAWRRQA